ncbi:MAG: DUF5667 domain-containing protein [Aggregatilineales bacterium]
MNDERALDFYTALDDCLDALFSGERTLDACLALYPEYAEDLKPDLQVALLASRLKSPAMSDSSVDALEAHLMGLMGDEKPITETTRPHRPTAKTIPFRPPMILGRAAAIILIAVLIAMGSGGGVVAASADSMPGETLYPVKRMWESIIIVLASITGQLDDVWVQLAETRFKEAQFGVDQDALTPEMLEDLWQATQKAIQYADESPELQAYLTVLAADLQAEHIIDSEDASHAQFITLIEPVLETLPLSPLNGSGDPTQQNNGVDFIDANDITATLTQTIVLSPTITLTPTSNANQTATLDVPIENTINTATFTATSRIPPTPTRTATPTITPTATDLPLILPSATITPLPPPTRAIVATAPEGGIIQPTAVYRPGDPTPIPTWFPYVRLTQDAFYLTRTAEWQGTESAP